jgi:agmatinase
MTSPFALLKPKDGFLSLEGDLAVSYEEAGAVIIPFGLEASVS